MNLLERITQAASGETETPPHVGEVMAIWTYYTAAEAARAGSLISSNHTVHEELSKQLHSVVKDVLEPQIQKLTDLMQKEGIPFSTRPPEVPEAAERDIPPGVKLTDMAISNRLVAGLEGLLVSANAALMQSLRDDIGLMFAQFHTQLLASAQSTKKLMRQHGWLQVPPPYRSNQMTTS